VVWRPSEARALLPISYPMQTPLALCRLLMRQGFWRHGRCNAPCVSSPADLKFPVLTGNLRSEGCFPALS
jgi:hypothetical protein